MVRFHQSSSPVPWGLLEVDSQEQTERDVLPGRDNECGPVGLLV